MSYRDVLGSPAVEYDGLISEGDLVATGENDTPAFEVIAIRDDKAWLRGSSSGQDAIVRKTQCRVLRARELNAA